MPDRPARRCPRCGELVHGRCPACSGWGIKPPSWSNLTAAETAEWRAFRADWLRTHPDCMELGCPVPASVVCHRPGTDYGVDRCNPAAIEGQRCRRHDAEVTARQGRAAQLY